MEALGATLTIKSSMHADKGKLPLLDGDRRQLDLDGISLSLPIEVAQDHYGDQKHTDKE